MDSLRRLARKVRGIAGLGLLGALAGVLVAVLTVLVPALWDFGFYVGYGGLWHHVWRALGWAAPWWALAGGATGAGFGTFLVLAERKRGLGDLPIWRMWLYGFLVGVAFEPAYGSVLVGWERALSVSLNSLPSLALLGILGGTLTSAFVAIARRTERAELAQGEETTGLLGRSVKVHGSS